MATYHWFGGTGTWDDSFPDNWSTTAPTRFNGTMTGTTTLTVSSVVGTALAVGKDVRTMSGNYVGKIVSGSGTTWTLDFADTYTNEPMGAGNPPVNPPNSADTVIFGANSGTGTVNIFATPACLALDASAMTSSLLFDGSTVFPVQVSGNATFSAAATFDPTFGDRRLCLDFVGSGASTLNCASTSVLGVVRCAKSTVAATLTISTNTLNADDLLVEAGTTTLSSNVVLRTTSGGCRVGGGVINSTLNINAATLTCVDFFLGDGGASTNTKTVVFTTGTLNIGTHITTPTMFGGLNSTNFFTEDAFAVFTRGTGRVVLGSTTPNATSTTVTTFAPLTFHDVLAQGQVVVFDTPNTYAGATTFGLRITCPASVGSYVRMNATQTVTGGTFSVVGNSVLNRVYLEGIVSPTIVLTGTTTRTLTNVDFRNCELTFSSSVGGTSLGDAKGNSGIDFSGANAPRTLYAKTGGSAFNYSQAGAGGMWYTDNSPRTTAASEAPRPQDTVIFDANTGNGVVTVNTRNLAATLNTTGWAGSFAFDVNYPTFYAVTPFNDFLIRIGATIYTSYTGTDSKLNGVSQLSFIVDSAITIPGASPSVKFYVESTVIPSSTLNSSINNLSCQIYWTANVNFNNNDVTCGRMYVLSLTNAATITVRPALSLGVSNPFTVVNFSGAIDVDNLIIYPNSTPDASFSQTQASFVYGGNVTFRPNANYQNLTFRGTVNGTFSVVPDFPSNLIFQNSATTTLNSVNLNGTKTAPIFIQTNGANGAVPATLAIANPTQMRYVGLRGITKSGAATATVIGPANFGNNTGFIFTGKTVTRVFTTVGASTFVVPSDFNGPNMFYVVGGGASGERPSTGQARGGGSGAIGAVSNLNLTIGQTVYLNIGAGGAASTGIGFNPGGQTWVNISSNAQPVSKGQGVGALGASSNTAASISTTYGIINNVSRVGGNGASGNVNQGGGGGVAIRLNQGSSTFFAGSGNADATFGGGGGGGGGNNGNATGVDIVPPDTAVGGGGAGVAGVGGAGGVSGASGLPGGDAINAGGGGGGGGAVLASASTAGRGGNGANGDEFPYTYLNSVIALGSIGVGGGGGGGGGRSSTQTNTVAGNGGNGGFGAGGGGCGNASAGRSNSGAGGQGFVVFMYEQKTLSSFGGVIG